MYFMSVSWGFNECLMKVLWGFDICFMGVLWKNGEKLMGKG